MLGVDITIHAGTRLVAAFNAIKSFDPNALLGPCLEMLRASKPLHIDLRNCRDQLAFFTRFLALIEEIEREQFPYSLQIVDRFVPTDGDDSPVWLPREGSKDDIVTALEAARERMLLREAAQSKIRSLPDLGDSFDQILGRSAAAIFKGRWGHLGVDGLFQAERDLVLIWAMHAELTSNGIYGYLENSSGDNAEETIGSLERAGFPKRAAILRRILDLIPNGWCADQDERQRRLDEMPDEWGLLRELDEELDETIRTEPPSDKIARAILNDFHQRGLLKPEDDAEAGTSRNHLNPEVVP